MQGIGAGLLVLSYGVFYAAWQQLSGNGGSVLYWMTGNPRFGAPPPKSGSNAGKKGGGGQGTGAANAPTKKNPGTPVPAPRR